MSPVGKIVLSVCDNDLTIDLSPYQGSVWFRVRLVALHLGVKIKGGS